MRLYGISHCSTVKKARDWLAQHDISVEFHDFKKSGLDAATIENWQRQSDWNKLVNRSGLTWRALSDDHKQQVCDAASAAQLMLDKPSVIKRPLLERDGTLLHVGFDNAAYGKIFNLES